MSDEQPFEVPLALVSSHHLDHIIDGIRAKSILWEGYERANLLNHAQVELIKSIDKKSSKEIVMTVNGKEQEYADLIFYLLQNLSRIETVQYVCVLADDFLSANELYGQYFFSQKESLDPLFKLLALGDAPGALQASKLLTILTCAAPQPDAIDLSPFNQWISERLDSSSMDIVDLVVQELESVLRVGEYRIPLWNTPRLVERLIKLLHKSASPQTQYQVIFCLWLLSFEPTIAASINEKYDIIPLLVELAKLVLKEKVIRISIATLRNLLEKAPAQNMAAMFVVKLLPFTENLSNRKWSDPDVLEDVNFIKERLQENFQSLSTFEQYASEVETGKFEWSPPHKSEVFWKENAYKLEENNFQHVRSIARILSTSTNPTVLAVAANDVGQYVKYASKKGKRLLQDIGAKQRIMELMTHEDQEVRYQALSAVQKLMHQPWEL